MSATQEQYIEFGVNEESYALKISDIQEIIKAQDMTDIPNCLPYVKGVINLRGKIVPIISIRILFSLPEDVESKTTRIIVVNHEEESVGIMVDRVNKVMRFTDIQPPPDRIGGISGAYFTGIGLSDQSLTGILKLNEVLLRN